MVIEFEGYKIIFFLFLSSLISTPPPERVPIKTHLSAYNKDKVISAIKFELGRGGQVFYVLPRIKGKPPPPPCFSAKRERRDRERDPNLVVSFLSRIHFFHSLSFSIIFDYFYRTYKN